MICDDLICCQKPPSIPEMMDTFSLEDFVNAYGYGHGPEYLMKMREEDFAHISDAIYLDHTGAALYSKAQIESHSNNLLGNLYGNPHSRNNSSILSTDLIDNVREKVARHFNTSLDEYDVVFTSGATGSLKLVAEAFDWSRRSFFCFLNDNHTSVVGMREVAIQKGASVRCLTEHEVEEATFKQKNRNCDITKGTTLEKLSPSTEIGGSKSSLVTPSSLFSYPAMSNFCGRKYPLTWTQSVQEGALDFLMQDGTETNTMARSKDDRDGQTPRNKSWYVFLDAASFVSSSALDLSMTPADFVCISFYKIFGFPTGLGALLVHKRANPVLSKKTYYGGGTVLATITPVNFHARKPNISDSFEDGTIPFLSIISLKDGFDSLERLCFSMDHVSRHTFALAKYTYLNMTSLQYDNGQPLCCVYKDTEFESLERQAPIINFNLLKPDGEFYGYSEVEKLAALNNIHLRTGCFCNTGDCQKHLGLSVEDMMKNFEAGHVCGDDVDLINGRPTGSVRISFGYMSTLDDANTFLLFLVDCFLLRKISNVQQSPVVAINEIRKIQFPFILSSKDAQELYERKTSQFTLFEDETSNDCHQSFHNDTGLNTERKAPTLHYVPHTLQLNSNESKHPTGILGDTDVPSIIESFPSIDFNNIYLKRLCLYPVKSCGAFEVDEWEIGPYGLLYDRCWIIVAETGISLTQKREPKMCMIKPKIDLHNDNLVLTCQGYSSVTVPLTQESDNDSNTRQQSYGVSRGGCTTKVCGDRIPCFDCGDQVASWLKDVLGQPCRLQRQLDSSKRKMKRYKGENQEEYSLSLSNVSQLLLISYKSVCRLYQEIYEQNGGVYSEKELASFADQFRANFIVDTEHPFEEDTWTSVHIGDLDFAVTGRSVRCQMICIDQSTGRRNPHPLRVLSKLRGTKMEFGIYLVARKLACGSKIRVNHMVMPSITT